jgi:hypothetical protein
MDTRAGTAGFGRDLWGGRLDGLPEAIAAVVAQQATRRRIALRRIASRQNEGYPQHIHRTAKGGSTQYGKGLLRTLAQKWDNFSTGPWAAGT